MTASPRAALMAAIAAAAPLPRTLDDLITITGFDRKTLHSNISAAANDRGGALLRRLKDDVTGQPAYLLTERGREWVKFNIKPAATTPPPSAPAAETKAPAAETPAPTPAPEPDAMASNPTAAEGAEQAIRQDLEATNERAGIQFVDSTPTEDVLREEIRLLQERLAEEQRHSIYLSHTIERMTTEMARLQVTDAEAAIFIVCQPLHTVMGMTAARDKANEFINQSPTRQAVIARPIERLLHKIVTEPYDAATEIDTPA